MEDLEGWIEEIKESGKLIIVEGQKDRKALEGLGSMDILSLKKPIYQVVEEAASSGKEVIILTDFDKKGKELYGKLKKDLAKHGVKVDRHFREFLQRNTKLSHIEGIKTYISNQEN